ncbi:MAG TPA: phage holin family protein [Candidatus Sulfotelmatobacter sp.]|nr:phage holin family protein [Candidatus Sulfotelmatobacter sp.]
MNYEANGKNLTTLLAEMKQELQDFVQTRITMLKVELQEKIKVLKTAAPLAIVGIVLLLTAYLLFTLAVVALVFAFLPDNAYRWCIAFAAVAVLWTLLGGVAAYFAKREFEVKGLLPKRTVEVLKDDKVWIQSEVKQI